MSTDPAIEQRDEHIRAAAEQSGLGAADLADELSRYAESSWLRDRQCTDCPPRLHGRLQAHLWHALKAWPRAIGEGQIATVIAAAKRRAKAAERDRRRRERERAGRLVVQIELAEDIVDELVARGRLGEWDERDRGAIGEAIARLVADYVDATRGKAE